MGDDEDNEEVDFEQVDHDTDVIPEALLAAARGGRAATSADWPPPPPRPAPQQRRARIYSVARRPGTRSE